MADIARLVRDLTESAPEGSITAWRQLPARDGRFGTWPSHLDPRLTAVLQARGLDRPYTHQAEAIEAAHAGKHLVVVTPTASGKTLCYNVPVIQRILEEPSARALYLFPTKALSQDQLEELQQLTRLLDPGIKTSTYDGDTPQTARHAVRHAGQIVITNPDMLHSAILPRHTNWMKLFENLRYVVIDELHTYRGVFGSHVANVLRRLKRLCQFYDAAPQFICCSATIANPAALAEQLIEEDVCVIDNDGSPKAEKHFIFYNPPVVNKELGIRRSAVLEARALAGRLQRANAQTIIFARSRVTVELLITYMKSQLRLAADETDRAVRGYRGGYLPLLRREIEAGLRDGTVRTVVSTNALELGIDIGQLEACIMLGYPGAISSTWQQAGRAGRRSGTSLALLIASSSPLDQFVINHPDYFFGKSPESALANPNNPLILGPHVKCGAFELPFDEGEPLGRQNVAEQLAELGEQQLLHHVGDRWHWSAESFPAADVSLRSASTENVVIVNTTDGTHVIGEMDRLAAYTLLHDQAIYLHEGAQYHVDKLDFQELKAYVKQVKVDYYTDANLEVDMRVLDRFQYEQFPHAARSLGEVVVTIRPSTFKKIKLYTHENIGWGEIHLPQTDLHTSAYWIDFPANLPDDLQGDSLAQALSGARNLLGNVAPLFVMCDPRDLRAVPELRSPLTKLPTIYLYDVVAGGVGLAERLYEQHEDLLHAALDLVRGCECEAGCPSCSGPRAEAGDVAKARATQLLAFALAGHPTAVASRHVVPAAT